MIRLLTGCFSLTRLTKSYGEVTTISNWVHYITRLATVWLHTSKYGHRDCSHPSLTRRHFVSPSNKNSNIGTSNCWRISRALKPRRELRCVRTLEGIKASWAMLAIQGPNHDLNSRTGSDGAAFWNGTFIMDQNGAVHRTRLSEYDPNKKLKIKGSSLYLTSILVRISSCPQTCLMLCPRGAACAWIATGFWVIYVCFYCVHSSTIHWYWYITPQQTPTSFNSPVHRAP